YLPNALVLLDPVSGGSVGAGDQESSGVVIDGGDLIGKLSSRTDDLAVHVDLALVPGAVADADRAAVLPAGQMAKLTLAEIAFTADAEHDLQATVGTDGGRRRGRHERKEVGCLIRASGDP